MGTCAARRPCTRPALGHAEESTGRWVLAVKQRWQFALEALYHRLGTPRVSDPLFDCVIRTGPAEAPDERVAGLFEAELTFGGLAVGGLVAADDVAHVDILLDGEPLRGLKVGGDEFFPRFHLEIKRSTLASFPREATLQVRLPDGTPLAAAGGAHTVQLTVPHGDGTLPEVLAAGGKLDKKGMISPSEQETRQRQQRYLELYARARDFFEQQLGRPLFLLYGTLLGYYRDGGFIPGDDDFDVGYISERSDPAAVKEETKQLVVDLIRAGFTVSFNRKGRLFRLQLEDQPNDGVHLDVRPVWFQDDRVWLHNHCSFPARREDFLPVADGELRGVTVRLPRDTEKFLRGHYGPGWTVPDPGFMYYQSEIDPAVLDNLSRALLSVREYRDLAERVRRQVGDAPGAGRLVSVGSQGLYPLERFLP